LPNHTAIRLCALADIPDGGGHEVVTVNASGELRILLLRRGSEVWGYINRCPHFLIPLNYRPDVFCTYEAKVLMCAHHSSMFRFEDGYCFDGPCQGKNLERVQVVMEEGAVLLSCAVSSEW